MADIRVKICGLTRLEDVAAVAAAGAAYAGLVFFAKSPRNVSVAQARALALAAPPGVMKVGLVVDADDATLGAILAEVPQNCDEYTEAHRLIKFMRYFTPIRDREIPPTSLLREFLGGSSFRY